jgi:osmotically-inducible protein OsmY
LALKQADASAPIADRIAAGTRLNVVGSDGDWLIVHSRAKNATVYVNRADAVPISDRTAGKSGANIELKWKEIELQIQEAILKRGVSGITVSFIGDTAFLKGTVQTEQQSRAAELAARTIPEVSHIHNGIWVRP